MSVSVRRADGLEFDIPLATLSQGSREWVQHHRHTTASAVSAAPATSAAPAAERPQPGDFQQLNELLGLDLWRDDHLWDDPPQEVAYRIGWPMESKTRTQSSFRVYFKQRSPIAGAIPYTAALYGRDGTVDSLSIIFANKGDSVTLDLIDNPRKAFKAVNQAIEADHERIEAQLLTLGKPKRQKSKTGKAMKERSLRWDIGNHSLLLAAVENEYLALRIMPPALADQRGQPSKVKSRLAKQTARANVVENDFGDVTISNIPMVDQGPKGYCVPATLERCLRYMGIRADMYALAMAGNTSLGGGTSIRSIIAGTQDYVKQAGHQMQHAGGEASTRDVRPYIDQGQPLLWAMYSTHEYNLIANAITRARMKATDLNEWQESLSALLKKSPKLKKDKDSAHICMIVGYNERSGELAVSDSWGGIQLRWISEDEAQDVSQGALYVIDF